jgi:hypothetical protein
MSEFSYSYCFGGSEYIPLDIITPFQGELKKRSEGDIIALIESIGTHGLITPLVIWNHEEYKYLLDGHGRYAALKKAGYTGNVPVVYIAAYSIEDAKAKLLEINSNYGKITGKGLKAFIGDAPAVIIPKALGVKVPEAPSTVISPVKKERTHGTVTLRLPLEKIDMFLDTIKNVAYIEILRGGKG